MTKDYKSHTRVWYERDDILEFQFIFYDKRRPNKKIISILIIRN